VTGPGWLSRSAADVPAGDGWLGPRERAALAALTVARRRADWRLGRWTAKAAVAALLGTDAERVEVVAAPDGAPEAWVDGERAPVSVSLSHRAGRALAAVATAPAVVGCDLELVEPRSGAFVREWLTEAEQARVRAAGAEDGARAANLAWTAKEAAAKVRREGLRLDVRHAESAPSSGAAVDGWRPLEVAWREGPRTAGWWREEPGWVMTVATEPASSSPPVAL
jgi:4'-phosphopantetheinyl transferase